MDVLATVLDPVEGGGFRLPRRRRGSSELLTACLCHAVQRMAPLPRNTIAVRRGLLLYIEMQASLTLL